MIVHLLCRRLDVMGNTINSIYIIDNITKGI